VLAQSAIAILDVISLNPTTEPDFESCAGRTLDWLNPLCAEEPFKGGI
jgi:hypothetical protein